MYIDRELTEYILDSAKKMPVITITGPRQSGKTTLVKTIFKDYDYVNMEFPLTRERFNADPISFFKGINKGIIIDEFQNMPDILSYIQVISDEEQIPGKFILTGSQNFLILEKVSQSLAGRTALFTLLPFSYNELEGTEYQLFSSEDYIFKGFYPRIYNYDLNPTDWLNDYINLYLERDIRQLINIIDVAPFSTFLKICAGRVGQVLNMSAISDIVGKDAKTIRSWISALEAGYIIYLLKPYYNNFNKRITKSPKLYFYDTGLLSSLLGIRNRNEIESHYAKGQLFENFIISEILKNKLNKKLDKELFFWNEQGNNEIDLLLESGNNISAIEIKASSSFSHSFTKNITRFKELAKNKNIEGFVVTNGVDSFQVQDIKIINWKNVNEVF
jgi:hypothetical protein